MISTAGSAVAVDKEAHWGTVIAVDSHEPMAVVITGTGNATVTKGWEGSISKEGSFGMRIPTEVGLAIPPAMDGPSNAKGTIGGGARREAVGKVGWGNIVEPCCCCCCPNLSARVASISL
jgi:hypothetical protein